MAVTVRGYLHHLDDRACIDPERLKYERFARKAIINGRAPLRVAHNKLPGATFAWADITEDRYGAKFECSIPDRSNSHALAGMIREGTDGISMSFRTIAKSRNGHVTIIERARLTEISIVPQGCYPSARCWVVGPDLAYAPPAIRTLVAQWDDETGVSELTADDMMARPRPRSSERARADPVRGAVRRFVYAYLSRGLR